MMVNVKIRKMVLTPLPIQIMLHGLNLIKNLLHPLLELLKLLHQLNLLVPKLQQQATLKLPIQ